jgi:hypothetical protein
MASVNVYWFSSLLLSLYAALLAMFIKFLFFLSHKNARIARPKDIKDTYAAYMAYGLCLLLEVALSLFICGLSYYIGYIDHDGKVIKYYMYLGSFLSVLPLTVALIVGRHAVNYR